MRKKLYYYLQREDIEMDNIFCKNLKSARIKAGMTQERFMLFCPVANRCYRLDNIRYHRTQKQPPALLIGSVEGLYFA